MDAITTITPGLYRLCGYARPITPRKREPMSLYRACDGPGCRNDQGVAPNDNQPTAADPPWITQMRLDAFAHPIRVVTSHFCSDECAKLYLTIAMDHNIADEPAIGGGDIAAAGPEEHSEAI